MYKPLPQSQTTNPVDFVSALAGTWNLGVNYEILGIVSQNLYLTQETFRMTREFHSQLLAVLDEISTALRQGGHTQNAVRQANSIDGDEPEGQGRGERPPSDSSG